MKKVFLIMALLVFQADIAQAAFSQFIAITPENEKEHGIQVRVSPLDGSDGKYILTVPVVVDFKKTWLVISRDRLDGPDQNLREFIWSDGKKGDPGIVALADLHPDKKYPETSDSNIRYVDILLDREIVDRAYVYIDFPGLVLDGGFYYSVDLGSYINGSK